MNTWTTNTDKHHLNCPTAVRFLNYTKYVSMHVCVGHFNQTPQK